MAYSTNQFRGSAQDGIRVTDCRGDQLFQAVYKNLEADLRARGIPAVVEVDEVKSGGLFGTRLPIIVVSHPNPPFKYRKVCVLVNDNVITFPLLGDSIQDMKERAWNRTGLIGSFILPRGDQLKAQQEESWIYEIADTVLSRFSA